MRVLTQAELGWAAGVLDGEGCIQLRTVANANSQHRQFCFYLAVGNTDPRMPQRMADFFGGNVVVKRLQKGRARPIFEWRLFSSKAGEVLRQLRPYLVIKGEQADVGLAFCATLKRVGDHGQDMRDARHAMAARLSVLKREEAV